MPVLMYFLALLLPSNALIEYEDKNDMLLG